ncbi:hypothetical protein [Altericroceibacterium spongiae]|uniref:hypothetical protein n=1 Tax=Altericroceibacterium spongiae TaxID=2320269 RepID=UPI0016048889|nr:hypothetical protein [Altericroceibacterium spongiae]
MSAIPFFNRRYESSGCAERLAQKDGASRHALPACAGLALSLRRLGHAPLLDTSGHFRR